MENQNIKKENNENNLLDISQLSNINNDIIHQIEDEAQKLDSIINEKDLKIFSKYENYTEDELIDIIKEKDQNLIKLSDEKENAKKTLNKIIKNLNKTISSNAEIFYKDEVDPETINELENVLELKKKELKLAKTMNQTFKNQYNSIKNKVSGNNIENVVKNDKTETHLIEIKNENKNLEMQIKKYKDDGVTKQKELEIICEDKFYPLKIKLKTDENQNLVNQIHEYNKKINMSLNSIKNLIKEVEHLEEIYSNFDKENKDKNGKLDKLILFWADIIKSDLMGSENDIISKIIKKESKFIKEIEKKENNNNEVCIQS